MTKAKTDSPGWGKPPTESDLARLLGESHAAFVALTERGASTRREWRRYNDKSPWVLKVSQGDRTLFYATPKTDAFEATVVLGKRATEAALAGRVSEGLHASIRGARAYAEGRPVRVVVKGEADLVGVEQLLAVKLDPTGGVRKRGLLGVQPASDISQTGKRITKR